MLSRAEAEPEPRRTRSWPSMSSRRAVLLVAPMAVAGVLEVAGLRGAYVALALLILELGAAAIVVSRRDATAVVSAYLAVMILAPSYLTLSGLGAAGSPITIVGIFALAWWIVSRLAGLPGIATGRQPVRLAVYLFGAAIVVSYAAAFTRNIPGIEGSAANRGILEILGLAGVALLIADGVDSRARLDVLGRRLVTWVAVLSAMGVFEFASGITIASLYAHVPGFRPNAGLVAIPTRAGFLRVQATSGSPIEFGLVLTCTLPLALHYAKRALPGRRLWAWVSVLLICAAIPMSFSRAAFVGVVIVLAVMFVGWTFRQRVNGLLTALAFVGGVRVLVPGLVGSIFSSFLHASSDPSVIHREQDLARVGFLVQSSVWFGRGFATFIPSEFTAPGQPVASLDNQYLGTIIETGLVGLATLILIFLVWFFTALGARRRSADPATRELALGLAASCLALVVGFYVFDVFGFIMISATMFVLLGFTGALWRLTVAEQQAAAVPASADGTQTEPAGVLTEAPVSGRTAETAVSRA